MEAPIKKSRKDYPSQQIPALVESARRKRKRRQEAGLYVACGESPPGDGKLTCSACREKGRSRYHQQPAVKGKLRRQRIEERRESGVCITCATAPPVAGRDQCQSCKDRADANAARLRAARRKKGQCHHCDQQAKPGTGTCETCGLLHELNRRQRIAAGLCTECDTPPEAGKQRCKFHLDRIKPRAKKSFADLRWCVIAAYGGPVCKCCGEDTYEFLQLDHINNDGANHRREVGTGYNFYWWLKRNGYPPGFQILCANCNRAKFACGGECPHAKKRRLADCPPLTFIA